MTGIGFLLPIALGLGLLGLGAFFWSVKSGQFEDLDGAAMRVLIEEEDSVDGD
jgi:cbb3-type cytochrome oxidase maturation protein